MMPYNVKTEIDSTYKFLTLEEVDNNTTSTYIKNLLTAPENTVFAGWQEVQYTTYPAYEAVDPEVIYAAGDEITVKKDIVVVPLWVENVTFSVEFSYENPYGVDPAQKIYVDGVKYGDDISMFGTEEYGEGLNIPEGKVLGGWYIEGDSSKVYGVNETYKNVTSNLKFLAKWVNPYTITVSETDGGTASIIGQPSKTYTVPEGTIVKIKAEPNDGFQFEKWFKVDDKGNRLQDSDNNYYTIGTSEAEITITENVYYLAEFSEKPLKGDFNKDGEVNAADVAMLFDEVINGGWKKSPYFDYNGDEKVNYLDILDMVNDLVEAGDHEILDFFDVTGKGGEPDGKFTTADVMHIIFRFNDWKKNLPQKPVS